ncbi:hypothetical protein [Aquifex aeolicus]|uniref:Fibronectin type-III domain-containing protein n=1 Tax=Aquifex aeolicus (strain VF5) TaxID=224324 RepID=O67471_AQUAE|nr:hypothetical protein [Aquifex aeolicus]AAC07436.1 putative protein [Aquifex aeolicus VF5]
MFLFLFFLLILSCGIKAPPKPLPEPQFSVKRIGEVVYVSGQNIEVKNFKKLNEFWYKKEKSSFCFEVKHVKGKSKKVCVKESSGKPPELEIKELKEKVLLIPRESGTFRIYRVVKDKVLYPIPLKEFSKETEVQKDYEPYYIGVTKVLSQDYESEPLIIKISPKPKPVPKPPYSAGYTVKGKKLIIYWFHENYEELIGFNVYKNGKKLNETPLKRNYFEDELPKKETLYEITAVNRFGIESKPVKVFFHPVESQTP